MSTNHQTHTLTDILIPTPLRAYTGGQAVVAVEGATVGQALDHLTAQFPVLRKHLFGDDGNLRSFVNIYLNDEDIRYLQRDETPLGAEDRLSIVPSIAGGGADVRAFAC